MKTNIRLHDCILRMFSTGRRDSTEIVYELLMLAKGGVNRNEMVREASLNFRLATRYAMRLTEMGLIRKDSKGALLGRYCLTSKGEKVLRILSQLEVEIDQSRSTFKGSSSVGQEGDLGFLSVARAGAVSSRERVAIGTGWFGKVRPFISYVLVVLAGIGLGYLIP